MGVQKHKNMPLNTHNETKPNLTKVRKPLQIKHFYKKNKADSFNTNGIKIIDLIWSEWRDLNPRHPAPKAGALPTALHPDT